MAEEKKTGGRPTGRPQGEAKKKAEVHKRGEGLGIDKVGNADYSGRNPDRPAAPSSGAGDRGTPLDQIGGLGGQSSHGNPQYGGGIPGGSGRRPRRSTGGGGLFRIIMMIIFFMFVMNMFRSCGGTSSMYSQNGSGTAAAPAVSTPAPTQTPSSAAASASVGGHWNPPATTYADASTNSVSTEVASGAREKFTKLVGNGKDRVTVMVYMCGTDLETNNGMATSDLNEMAYADHSDNLNIIVETGGTRRWRNSVVSNSTNQRWGVSDRSLVALNKNVGRRAMSDPSTLSDFIQWGAANYPADRYILILWDHGGGSLQGYCHDEYYPNSTMTVDQIGQALKDGGVKFDIVGFDACLMGNLETALAVEPYADYLLASEETEPGTGWYYTDWVSKLARNTSMPSTDLGKAIVDDFIAASRQYSSRDKTTLSLVDLAEFHGTIPSVFNEFSKEITTAIKRDDYKKIADARGVTREFAQSTRIDQIDLIHFCKNLGTTGASSLANSLQSCIKYNRCANITNAYGMSIYFPYYSPSKVSGALLVYQNIGMDSEYSDAIRSFATLSASGQVATGSYTSPLFDLLSGGGGGYSNSYDASDLLGLLLGNGGGYSQPSTPSYPYGGYYSPYGSGSYGGGYSIYDLLGGRQAPDTDSLQSFTEMITRNHVDPSHLILTENSSGQKVLTLSQSDWDLIHDVNLNVWVDDGEGYIDLGFDNVSEFDADGSLIMQFSGTWPGLNGQPVSVYPTSYDYIDEDNWEYNCYVPVLYNGERANILMQYSSGNEDKTEPVIIGVMKVFEDGVPGKGYIEVNPGDQIDLLCDYYDYNGTLKDVYKLGEQIVIGSDGLKAETLELTNSRMLYGYRLTDIYNGNMWTPMLRK